MKIVENYEKIIKKDNHIDYLDKKINNILDMLIKANVKLDDTLCALNDTHYQLEETNDKLEETNEKLDYTDNKLNIIATKLDVAVEDRVIKPLDLTKREYFIVMKNINAEYKYYVIRGQKRHILRKKNRFNWI
jgi:DNA repair ATPase RecN